MAFSSPAADVREAGKEDGAPEAGEAAMALEAFEGFYARTRGPLWHYLRRVSGDPAVADDVLQEAYLRLLRRPGRAACEAERRSYLYRVATNLLLDRHRAQGRERRLLAAAPPSLPPAEGPPGPRLDLERALGRLRPRERSLLWLAYAEGWTHREIGAALGLREGSVRVLLFRARKKALSALRHHHRSEDGP